MRERSTIMLGRSIATVNTAVETKRRVSGFPEIMSGGESSEIVRAEHNYKRIEE